MECKEAQALISEALDGGTIDRAALEEAKQHCRECADCASFVRGLSVVKRAPLPQPDAGLIDRVMAAVRAEAAVTARVAAAAPAQPVDGAPAAAENPQPLDAQTGVLGAIQAEAFETTTPRMTVRARPRPAVLAAWIGAAALLVASAGTVGIMGIRLMSQGQSGPTTTTLSEGAVAPSGTQGTVQGFVPPAAKESSAGSARSASSVPSYITAGGMVYRLVGPSDKTKAQLAIIGSTTSSLDGGELRARDVLQLTGDPSVYVEDDSKKLLEFKVVERTYQGRTYRLRSADLFGFGSWPALPTDVAQAGSGDGASTFTEVGPDSSGVIVYRLPNSTPEQGIAVGPGTSDTDPAGGNPGWTWWTPGS